MHSARWLSDDEQAAWRAFLLMRQLLDEALDRQLQREAGMPHTYYAILVTLSESDEQRLRMSELAGRLRFSPSRLTHAITSLERSGWVRRQACPEDRRGQLAMLTDAGRAALVAAAPGHVAEVRRLMFDQIDADQVDQLREVCERVLAAIDPSEQATDSEPTDSEPTDSEPTDSEVQESEASTTPVSGV